MKLVCKCGHIHLDSSKLKIKQNLMNHIRHECQLCGKTVYVRTVGPSEFKRLTRMMQQTDMA